MLPIIIAMSQAVTSVPSAKIDLAIPQPCETRKPIDDEIIVCGRRSDGSSPYRINQPSARPPGIPKADLQLANGVSVSAETENVALGGVSSNRLMARLKIRF